MNNTNQMLDWLDRHRNLDVIKIVTGVRGCGKTTLLNAFAERLETENKSPCPVIRIDFEHADHLNVNTPEALMDFILAQTPDTEKNVCLLLDEICELTDFDVALGALFALKRYNIFVACSTRRPVSERFTKYLSGRFVSTELILPSFRELPLPGNSSFEQRLNDYMHYGALPYTFKLRGSPHDASTYLSGLWNTILVKDVLTRNRMADAHFTERLLGRIYRRIGETESLRRISADAAIKGHEPAPNTVLSYITALNESMLMYRVPKYDAFTGETSKGGYRFYLADLALGFARYGAAPGNNDNVMRNIIYLELLRRGGAVYCGRYDNEDFDFVVVTKDRTRCWQFAPKTVNGRIPAAVIGPLKRLPRTFSKTVITRSTHPCKPVDGISFITLEQFLTGKR